MKPLTIIFIFCISINMVKSTPTAEQIVEWADKGYQAWEIFNKIFFPPDDTEPSKKPPKILMRYPYYGSNNKIRDRRKYVSFGSKKINKNKAKAKKGPFSEILLTAQTLTKKKKSELDVTECELQYYVYNSDGNQEAIQLFDDNDVLILIGTKDGDQETGSTRLIDVICVGINEPPEQSVAVIAKLYKKQQKAFDHVIAIQNEKTKDETEEAAKELTAIGLAGFDVDAKGLAIIDIDKDSFKPSTDAIAEAWGWDAQIKSLLGIVTKSGRQFSGGLNVVFDASEWTIKGAYARFAGFKTVESKYSIYVATAKFTFKVPKGEREGGMLDKWGITSGGSIKSEYFEKIKILMEGRALERFGIDVSRPDVPQEEL
eukprot:833252_1